MRIPSDGMLAAAAAEYLSGLSPLAERSAPPDFLREPERGELLSYFRSVGGQKLVRDESGCFRDEHSAPFTFRSRSQTDLVFEGEIQRAPEIQDLDRELVLSHSKVLSELKNALKFEPKVVARTVREEAEVREIREDPAPERPKPSDEGGFISRLIGKRSKGGGEERERLVSPERRCQIVASSDNFFKTDFGSSEPKRDRTTTDSNMTNKHIGNYKSVSGLEEARALLGGSVLQDSLGASTDSEFLSCEDTPGSAVSPSSSTLMLPKTGYDFLDNW